MLPCNVVVQDLGGGRVEVTAIDPVASMQAIENPRLKVAAEEVRSKLQRLSTLSELRVCQNKGVHSVWHGCAGMSSWQPALVARLANGSLMSNLTRCL
jgi:hypothetical protein